MIAGGRGESKVYKYRLMQRRERKSRKQMHPQRRAVIGRRIIGQASEGKTRSLSLSRPLIQHIFPSCHACGLERPARALATDLADYDQIRN